MSHKPLIRVGAIFVADSHYNPLGREEIEPFLRWVLEQKPPQLFLLGDIFDLLIGAFGYTVRQNSTLISLINEIARSGVEVWFFEGNHDFMLDDVFDKSVHIINKLDQPKEFELDGKKAVLLHGDYSVELRYEIYAKLIRSKIGIFLAHIFTLNFVNNWFLKLFEKKLISKNLCYEIANFQTKRRDKLKKMQINADILIEGHFHQDLSFDFDFVHYRNLPSFACGKSFVEVQSTDFGAVLKTLLFDEKNRRVL